MSELKEIASHGKVYLLANLINRSAGLLLIPVYTRVLTLEDYGLYAIVMAVSDLFTIIFGMGFTGAMNRFYFDYDENSLERKRVVSTTLIGFMMLSVLLLILSYPLSYGVVSIMFGDAQYLNLFVLVIAGLVFTVLYEILLSYAVIRKRPWIYLFMASIKAILFIGMNIYMVVFLEMGVPGIVYSSVLSLGFISVVTMLVVLVQIGPRFSFDLLISMMKFGLPLVPSAFANSALMIIERYFLNTILGPAAVAVYALGHRIASMLQMFIAAPFSQIFFVRRFETLAKGEDQAVFQRILLLFVVLMTTAIVGLSVFSEELLFIVATDEYSAVGMLIPVLGVCFLLSSLNLNIELGILYQKKTWAVPVIGFVALVVAVPANYWLISGFGIWGAVFALLVVNVARLLTTVYVNNRLGSKEVTLNWLRASAIIFFGLLVGQVSTSVLPNELGLHWLVVKCFVLAAFLVLVIKGPFLDRATKSDLAALFGPLLRKFKLY